MCHEFSMNNDMLHMLTRFDRTVYAVAVAFDNIVTSSYDL